jgi:hypothetical protein
MMPRPNTQDTSSVDERPFREILWTGWRDYNALVARYQRSALLSAIYLFVLGPSGLLARLSGQQLMGRARSRASSWIQRSNDDATLAALKRQY